MAPSMVVDVSAEVQADVSASLESANRQVAELLAWAQKRSSDRLWEAELTLAKGLRELGCALLALWLASRRSMEAPRHVAGADGRRYRWHGSRVRPVKTSVGEASARRDFYIVGQGTRGNTYVPLDHELGLEAGGFSLRAICMATYLCAKAPFADARSTLQRFWGWAPATKSLLKMTDQLGPLAQPFLTSQPAPDDDGEFLYIQVDSKGAPMITDTEMERRRRPHRKRSPSERKKWRRRKKATPRRRRKKGDKSKNAKMANVGIIYTLRVRDGVVEGPIDKRVYATFRKMKDLMECLLLEATKRGYGVKSTVFLADGDRKIWKLQQKHFPLATPCLDYFHVSEKIWSIGETLYPEGSDELADWVKEHLGFLLAGRSRYLLRCLERFQATLPRSGPGTRGRRSRMAKGIAYLRRNRHRMPYADLRKQGLDIGSGAIEGAVRQLGLRLDGPGMRWSPARAEYVLQLRCLVINGMWSSFEEHVQRVASDRGLPARAPDGLGPTHNAKRKQAA
jgi:hypothetical protein